MKNCEYSTEMCFWLFVESVPPAADNSRRSVLAGVIPLLER